jgi:hypothetical protein
MLRDAGSFDALPARLERLPAVCKRTREMRSRGAASLQGYDATATVCPCPAGIGCREPAPPGGLNFQRRVAPDPNRARARRRGDRARHDHPHGRGAVDSSGGVEGTEWRQLCRQLLAEGQSPGRARPRRWPRRACRARLEACPGPTYPAPWHQGAARRHRSSAVAPDRRARPVGGRQSQRNRADGIPGELAPLFPRTTTRHANGRARELFELMSAGEDLQPAPGAPGPQARGRPHMVVKRAGMCTTFGLPACGRHKAARTRRASQRKAAHACRDAPAQLQTHGLSAHLSVHSS